MRKSILHPQLEELKVTNERRQKFDSWLAAELMDAKAARTALEALWRELVRQYDAVPRTPFRNTPIENASNVEIPLGAIAVDSIYAQMIDLIWLEGRMGKSGGAEPRVEARNMHHICLAYEPHDSGALFAYLDAQKIEHSAKPQDNLEVGFGLSTAEDGDPVSSNQTIGDGGSRKDVYVELAYFNWAALDGLNVSGGKYRNGLYRPGKHALLWDSDWNPEGFGATYTQGLFFSNLLGTWLESDSNNTEEFSAGLQAGVALPVSEGIKLTAGLGYFDFSTAGKGFFFGEDAEFGGNSFDPVTNEYLFNYEMLEVFAEVGFKAVDLPMSVFVDYVNNSDADEFDTGWAAGLLVGGAKAKGTWEASYAYQDLEADAVLALLTDSDFGGGGTDNSGHVLRGAYALGDRWNLAFSYFINTINENAGNKQDYDRLQLDMNFKY